MSKIKDIYQAVAQEQVNEYFEQIREQVMVELEQEWHEKAEKTVKQSLLNKSFFKLLDYGKK